MLNSIELNDALVVGTYLFVLLFLFLDLYRRQTGWKLKVVLAVLILTPIIGPVFYFFIVDMPKKLPAHQQNNLARGEYFREFSLIKRFFDKGPENK